MCVCVCVCVFGGEGGMKCYTGVCPSIYTNQTGSGTSQTGSGTQINSFVAHQSEPFRKAKS